MKRFYSFMIVFAALALIGCQKEEVMFTGETMGTTYHVKVIAGSFTRTSYLKEKIDNRLKEINLSMSIFIPDSEISKFNALKDTNKKFYVSDDFMQVIATAENLYGITQGAWDGTVNPLVNLWGFGKDKREKLMPTQEEVVHALKNVGFYQIEISAKDKYLRKKNPEVTLDLGSIAKGYGVDQVAELIEKNGFKNYIVEIGGEIYASGLRPDDKAWRAGINTPKAEAGVKDVYKVVKLENQALATSGDYRNFFQSGNYRFSHIIDPKTGFPIQNGVVSVSVTADNCTFADGLATALMVLGPDIGIPIVNNLKDVECLFIVQQPDGYLREFPSKGFKTEG
jgi:thiamine biosynthesis lipoprotein